MPLTQRQHIGQMSAPGDYVIIEGNPRAVPPIFDSLLIACPVCGKLMGCVWHQVSCRNPLTVSPSIIGPHNAIHHETCNHHFSIVRGTVTVHPA